MFQINNEATKCNCTGKWSGDYCATGPSDLLLYSCGIYNAKTGNSSLFQRMRFPFSETNETTKIRSFRSNDYFYSFFLDDYLHIQGTGGKDSDHSFGSYQVCFFFFLFFLFFLFVFAALTIFLERMSSIVTVIQTKT